MREAAHTADAETTWLILNGNSSVAGSEPDGIQPPAYQVTHGRLDEYPDRPAGYDGIIVRMDADFWRWTRWHLQDLARQLKPDGILAIERPPFAVTRGNGIAPRLKRCIRIQSWKIATVMGSRPLRKRLLPRFLPSLAARFGLKIDLSARLPESKAAPFRGICFRRKPFVDAENLPRDPQQLERLFRQHFGDWIEKGFEPEPNCRPPIIEPASLSLDPSGVNVLVLSPHPDDELIGCGGTLLGLAAAGATIHVVQMTEGMTCLALRDADESTRRQIRWREAKAVAKRFGFTGHYWATGGAENLEATAENCERLRRLLCELKPSLVFIPAATDRHPEHRLANQIFQQSSTGLPATTRVLEYPVWGFLPAANLAVDVTGQYPEVLDALYLYKTAMKAEDYFTRCQVLAVRHGYRMHGSMERCLEVYYEWGHVERRRSISISESKPFE